MPGMEPPAKLVVGTAGHIDHGKSRLVLALTGTDPDRLPEEQARGMTIDLGFAHATIDGCDISFVDVPGHERFIRNMLAGATGIDVALLVVAGDDSVMPQTREHAEVLSLLGIERCALVLTKMDLVDDDWAAQVEAEARELLAGLGLTPVGCVRTSAVTGRGLDELRQLLAQLAREQSRRPTLYRWFRLPIDRSFVIAGRGTVVTGSVAHGSVARDDELELWPAGRRVRVRDLQTHHAERDRVEGRTRLALNLAGIAVEEVGRGGTLATPGYLRPTRYLDVWLAWLRMPGKTPRQRLRLRLHFATSEVLTELHLLEKPAAERVAGQFGQLKAAAPVVATWGERFILRDESGTRTLGGGRILRPAGHPWTARRPAHRAGLEALREGAPAARLEEVIRAAEWEPLDEKQLAARAGLGDEAVARQTCQRVMSAGQVRWFEAAATRAYVHNTRLAELAEDLNRRLARFVQENPRLPGLPHVQWATWMPNACPARLRPVLAEWYLESGQVAAEHDRILPAGARQPMSPADAALLAQILAEFDAGAFQPPALSELQCRTPKNEKRVRELVELAAAQGTLVRLGAELWLHEKRWRELVVRVSEALRARGGLTVADIRTLLNSSRKYVVPIVEQLDAAGITRRVGDLRQPGPRAPAAR